VRIDKWLWAARFFKTRSLAQDAVGGGKVKVGDERVKPARELKAGDVLAIRVGEYEWIVTVKALTDRRGPAEVARALYEESEESRTRRAARLRIAGRSARCGATGKAGRPSASGATSSAGAAGEREMVNGGAATSLACSTAPRPPSLVHNLIVSLRRSGTARGGAGPAPRPGYRDRPDPEA
jgi:ribosome-associated heat shock protein Hsp15